MEREQRKVEQSKQLSKTEKEIMKRELENFRKKNEYHSVKWRLSAVPFIPIEKLFNMSKFKLVPTSYPCRFFGKQLVLKIVDELLD